MLLPRRLLLATMSFVIAVTMLSGCAPAAGTPAAATTAPAAQSVSATAAPAKAAATTAPAAQSAATTAPAAKGVQGGTLKLAATKAGDRLDPHQDVAWEVLYCLGPIYDTLVYQAKDGSFVAGLAKEWKVSDDGKTYTFTLRDDVKFHDGTPFNAEAVKFNFERIKSLKESTKAGPLMALYASSEVTGPYTIAIHLSQSDGFFLYKLSLPYIAMVSPTAVQKWGDQYQNHQVGTGPFMVSEWVSQDHYTLVPNPDYNWAPSIYAHQGRAYLDKIIWTFLPDTTTRAPALLAGDVDVAIDIDPNDGARVKDSGSTTLSVTNLTGEPTYWFMNTKLAPTDDLKVRQAIIYALDMKSAVATIQRGYNKMANGPLSAVTAEYTKKVEGLYSYDVAKAKALLDEAGWKDTNGDGIREKDGKTLTLQMSTQPWGQSKQYSELAQSQLKTVGIDMKLEALSWGSQLDAGAKGTKNLLFMGGSGYTADDSLVPYFHSKNADSGFAWAKAKDPELDALLDKGAAELDAAKRTELYAQAQVRIMDQALIVPIYDYVVLIGVNNKVKGLNWTSIGLVPTLYDTYLEK